MCCPENSGDRHQGAKIGVCSPKYPLGLQEPCSELYVGGTVVAANGIVNWPEASECEC